MLLILVSSIYRALWQPETTIRTLDAIRCDATGDQIGGVLFVVDLLQGDPA